MKRLRRWIFNSLVVVSGVLCIGLVASWTRSYWFVDTFYIITPDSRTQESRITTAASTASTQYGVNHVRGIVQLYRHKWSATMITGAVFPRAVSPNLAVRYYGTAVGNIPSPTWKWLGFSYENSTYWVISRFNPFSRPLRRGFASVLNGNWRAACTIRLPHWFLVIVTAVLPSVWLTRLRRARHRKRLGLCLHCGYDLRASKDRCPECGTAIQGAAASSAVS